MSFRFSLGRAQVKHFKTALQTLNKIGGELLVEAVPEQLVLRSINTAKSAFLSVTYFSRFFDNYEIYDTAVVQTVVASKNALAIFRSPKITQIEFTLDNAAAKLLATVHTDEGLIKRYSFNCLDGEVLQAAVDRDAYPTVVIAEAPELEKLLSSFQHTLDEITLIANPLSAANVSNGHKACQIRSFVDPLKAGQESALLTSLTLDTRSVFTSYSHTSPLAADVTFNVKDFRTMTALCTALGADVALRLEAAGAPLVVEPHFRGLREGSETDFQAMLVLSTLTDSQLGPEHLAAQQALEEEDEQGQQQQQQQQQLYAVAQQPQHHHQQQQPRQQQQPWPQATEADPPSPYDGGAVAYGGAAQQGRSAGGGGGGGRGGAPAGSGGGAAGRPGRRRLPSRQDGGSGGAAAAPVAAAAARGAYAAAAAAEGLPSPRPLSGAAGWPGGGAGATPVGVGVGAAAEDSLDGLEDDLPARRTGRPPRYDPAQRATAAAAAAAAAAAGLIGGDGGGGPAADVSFLHPPPPPQQVALLQRPTDPRVGAHGAGGHQQQQQYLQFPRGSGPRPEDSQDPEGLPGMRSPYGRQGGAGPGPGPGQAGARGPMYGSHGIAAAAAGGVLAPGVGGFPGEQPFWAAAAAAEEARGGAAGAHAGRAAGPAAPGYPPPEPAPEAAGPYAQPYRQHPQEGAALQHQRHQHREQQQEQQQQREQPMTVDHAALFGEDDGGFEGEEGDGDDDEEVPATPPDQQQTRSMGAGVLGLGMGGGPTDQAG